jgi:hypothetical protein
MPSWATEVFGPFVVSWHRFRWSARLHRRLGVSADTVVLSSRELEEQWADKP